MSPMSSILLGPVVMLIAICGSDGSELNGDKASPRLLRHSPTTTHRELRKASFFCGEQYPYVGCYADAPYAPALVDYGAPKTYYECAEACKNAGYDFMGRQYTEQCGCGNYDPTNATGYTKYGEAENCNCSPNTENIGSYKMCVYDLREDRAETRTTIQDVEIRSSSLDANYGATNYDFSNRLATSIQSGCTTIARRSLLEFDLRDIDIDPTCATLRLKVINTSNGVRSWIDIYRLDEGFSWKEDELTWNSYYPITTTPPMGVKGSTQLFVKQQTDRYQFVEVDVSDLLAQQAGKNVTLFLQTQRYENNVAISCNTIEFSSKEVGGDDIPELILTGNKLPTMAPTDSPTKDPSRSPTSTPTKSPSSSPTGAPTKSPTLSPTNAPSESPTNAPTNSPTCLGKGDPCDIGGDAVCCSGKCRGNNPRRCKN